MEARLNLEAPTFTSLNKPQKRALVLRDQLRYVDPAHLNTFIEGITDDEPPTYTKINGVIKPDLTFVTVKEEATRFDLGNIILPDERNAIQHVYLVIDNGQIQMRAEAPLPLDDDVMESVPIHAFIAKSTVDMFRDKYFLIHMRVKKINEARRAAFNMPNLPPAMFHNGETLTRLDPSQAEQGNNQVARRTRKREPNEEVTQHVSNKRKRTGLASISEEAKSKTFDTIPSHFKVDLFNSIVKTAFPNFDNLMVASWNVVSVYSACGSDFPELHRSIVELKGVLQDFEEATGERVDRTPPSYRQDFGGPSQSGMNGTRNNDDQSTDDRSNGDHPNGGRINEDRLITSAPTHTQNGADTGNQVNQSVVNENENVQQPEELSVAANLFGGDDDRAEPEMPAPHIMQLTQPQENQAEQEEEDDDEDEIPPVDPRLNVRLDRQSNANEPSPSHMTDGRRGGGVVTSSETTLEPEHTRVTHARVEKTRRQNGETMSSSSETSPEPRAVSHDRVKEVREQNSEANAEERDFVPAQSESPEPNRRRDEYLSSIGKANALANLRAATPVQTSRADDTDSHSEHDRPAPPLHNEPIPTPASTSTAKPTPRKMSGLTTEQIKTRLAELKAGVLKTFNSMDQAPQAKLDAINKLQAALEARERKKARTAREREREREREQADAEKEDRRSGNGMFGSYSANSDAAYLGNSMLGAKKPMGVAPVAPMIPGLVPMGVNRDGYMASSRNGRTGGSPPRGRRNN